MPARQIRRPRPASRSLSTPMICSSVNRARFKRPDSKSPWRKRFKGAANKGRSGCAASAPRRRDGGGYCGSLKRAQSSFEAKVATMEWASAVGWKAPPETGLIKSMGPNLPY
jgi:hypothetical protein